METHPKSSAFLFQLWSQGYDSEALLRHRIKSSFCDSFKNNQLPGPHKVSFFCYLYIQINTQFLSDFCLINGKWGLYPVYVLRLLWKFPIWEFFKLIKTHSLFSSSFLFPLLREELSLTFVKNILGYPTLIPFLALSVILSSVLLKCLAFVSSFCDCYLSCVLFPISDSVSSACCASAYPSSRLQPLRVLLAPHISALEFVVLTSLSGSFVILLFFFAHRLRWCLDIAGSHTVKPPRYCGPDSLLSSITILTKSSWPQTPPQAKQYRSVETDRAQRSPPTLCPKIMNGVLQDPPITSLILIRKWDRNFLLFILVKPLVNPFSNAATTATAAY